MMVSQRLLRGSLRSGFSRAFSTGRSWQVQELRIGYVPEHFSTPLYFAQKYFDLDASLIPYPSGTGHMIQSLKADEIDVGIGLTEGWVAGLGKEEEKKSFQLVGTYVETPLCWAIVTGAARDLKNVAQLKSSKLGVSRIGSGSYVMGYVLADQQGWLGGSEPFQVVPLSTFAKLRDGVNDGTADFFMWEHFTTKRYVDSGEIKRIGEIYTPWSSWKIVARDSSDGRIAPMLEKINRGIAHFDSHQDEAVQYISTSLDYSAEDAEAWLRTVKFPKDTTGVKAQVIQKTISSLVKAGVLGTAKSEDMIALEKH